MVGNTIPTATPMKQFWQINCLLQNIVELCICKCRKGYESLRCRSKKNNLICTKMCMRSDCKNCPNEELIINNESRDT